MKVADVVIRVVYPIINEDLSALLSNVFTYEKVMQNSIMIANIYKYENA